MVWLEDAQMYDHPFPLFPLLPPNATSPPSAFLPPIVTSSRCFQGILLENYFGSCQSPQNLHELKLELCPWDEGNPISHSDMSNMLIFTKTTTCMHLRALKKTCWSWVNVTPLEVFWKCTELSLSSIIRLAPWNIHDDLFPLYAAGPVSRILFYNEEIAMI